LDGSTLHRRIGFARRDCGGTARLTPDILTRRSPRPTHRDGGITGTGGTASTGGTTSQVARPCRRSDQRCGATSAGERPLGGASSRVESPVRGRNQHDGVTTRAAREHGWSHQVGGTTSSGGTTNAGGTPVQGRDQHGGTSARRLSPARTCVDTTAVGILGSCSNMCAAGRTVPRAMCLRRGIGPVL